MFLLGCLLGQLRPRSAQSYPDRTVTIVVTSAAGALTDVLTRAVGQRLSQMWSQSSSSRTSGGAGHTSRRPRSSRRRADGYTLLATETGFVTSQPHL